jgi:signal transduction histidine kinase
MPVHCNSSGVNNMPTSNRLFCRLDGLTPNVREQQRVSILKNLGLLETDTVPVFDEATQTAARFTQTPICTLGLMVNGQLWLKSAIGLSRLGLMNQIASSRKIPQEESFCAYVVDSQQPLIIEDTYQHPVFAKSLLSQHYGIRAYLGTPLTTGKGWCIGTLAVMDVEPRLFTTQEIEFLDICARWCIREFERDYFCSLQSEQQNEWLIVKPQFQGEKPSESKATSFNPDFLSKIKLKLLAGLTQELRTPLTAIIGMASILHGEVFGSLTHKQKEYVEIIRNSGQQINAFVDEMLRLGETHDVSTQLQLNPVNIEMLCQQVLNDLATSAQQTRQELRLSVEPGKRIWLLDKDKVQQALYYLVISVLESSDAGGEIRIHVSRRSNTLNIALWISHPWLGDGLPQVKFYSSVLQGLILNPDIVSSEINSNSFDSHLENHVLDSASLEASLNQIKDTDVEDKPQALLGLLLACHIAESHGGTIMVQGSAESGYRYVLMLPKISAEENGRP